MLKIGIVGAGAQGQKHARKLKEIGIKISGIVDISPEKAEELGKSVEAPALKSLEELRRVSQGIIIATPASSHYAIAKFFLSSSLPILIEKPFTLQVWQAKRLIELSRDKKVIIGIGMIERFHPGIQFLKKNISSPRFIEVHRLGPFPYRGTDTGVIMDLMIHDLDLIVALLKEPIKKIQALGARVISSHEDIANVRITFASGCVANITASRVSEERLRKLRIFEQGGYFSLSFPDGEMKIYRKEKEKILKYTKTFRNPDPLKAELLDFTKAITNNTQPLVRGEEALNSLVLACKIRKILKKSLS
ncbi:MAG: Gfo/Idh/MocA family oxidoreductase [Caldiserica bacterium]|nr:Gfo/Idh/MocA family oxidoreductase [Caldisericota bacterium]